MPSTRRFPAPWSVEEQAACFIVRDQGVLAFRGQRFARGDIPSVASLISDLAGRPAGRGTSTLGHHHCHPIIGRPKSTLFENDDIGVLVCSALGRARTRCARNNHEASQSEICHLLHRRDGAHYSA